MDVAALRQRVLASLKKSKETVSEDSEIEEGEIQEAVDNVIAAKTQDFRKEPVSSNFLSTASAPSGHGIPGLKLSQGYNMLQETLSSQPPSKFMVMPQDLPVATATTLPVLQAQAPSYEPPAKEGRRREPLVQHVQNKRAISAEFAIDPRPLKRFGPARHPSLVIDLESDDETAASTHKVSGSVPVAPSKHLQDTSAAKLRQVEAEIAQAMAVINKAQQLQLAKRAETANVERPSPQPGSDFSMKTSSEILRKDSPAFVDLRNLQRRLTVLDEALTSKRGNLQDLRAQDALVASQQSILDMKEHNCAEVIQSIEDDVARLQRELAVSRATMQGLVKQKQDLLQNRQALATTQEALAGEIAGEEQQRRVVFEEIAATRAKIVLQETSLDAAKKTTESLSNGHAPKLPARTATASDPTNVASSTLSAESRDRRVAQNGIASSNANASNPRSTVLAENRQSPISPKPALSGPSLTNVEKTRSVPLSKAAVLPPIAVPIPAKPVPSTEQITKDTHKQATPPVTVTDGHSAKPPTTISHVSETSVPPAGSKLMSSGDSVTEYPERKMTGQVKTLYQSPLAIFMNFKYNAQYQATVSAGYRSSTYFHKIQPNEVMCADELQGAQCSQGTKCTKQHFANIKMTGPFVLLQDDEILVELSSRTIGKTNKERMAYREGLRAVLQDMKAKNIDDFEQVCARMVEYRRTQQEHPDQSISSFF